MRRRSLSLTLAAVLTAGLAFPGPAPVSARDSAPAADAGVWPYSVLPGFDPLQPSADPVVLTDAQRELDVTYTYEGETRTLRDYLRRTAQGFVVLDGDRVVNEWYAPGYHRDSLFQSWSAGKSFTSDAVGIALGEGRIRSLDDTVGDYVPELAGTDYGKVRLYNLLRMSSGMKWEETPDDAPLHVSVSMGWRSTLQWAATRKKVWEQGTRFNYSSMDSAVLALVVQRATGVPFHRYMAERIWGPSGMAGTAYLGNDSNGNSLGYCCVYATVRDFARFGRMMLDGGTVKGRQVVPASWVAQATTPSGVNSRYGLHWWIDSGEGFQASGLGDQKIYVSTRHNVVIARNTFLNLESGDTLPALRAVAAEVARTRTGAGR
ncbi:serine hydrolase domain-containing protein [Actinocorallia populi]|uniref:serine hydrolase domain-containing protein n=1 Tax=Actinocorallia populi TaxID=2079200 RepID=UPI000D0899E1|nr:serine hydrolase domain-containing protein [Actinocorallia populi]